MNVKMDSPNAVLFKDLGRVACWLKRKIKVAGTFMEGRDGIVTVRKYCIGLNTF